MRAIRFMLRCCLGWAVAFGPVDNAQRFAAALDALDRQNTRLSMQDEAHEVWRRG